MSARLDQQGGPSVTKAQQYCTFFVDGLLFGVEVERVQEVVDHQELTRTPLAPPAVSGLINLRGQIITAIDLRCRLGLPESTAGQRLKNAVVATGDSVVSLLVDEIGEVANVEADLFECPPETLSHASRKLIRGVCKLQDRLLLLLDIAEVANTCVPSHAAA